MAVKKIVSEYIPYTRKEFAVFISDTKEEAKALPTDYSPGSFSIIADSGDDSGVVMLNASSMWKDI